MLHKMGFNGGGLGKHENGIHQPITVQANSRRQGIGTNPNRVTNNIKPWPPNTTLIIGDSMLGGLEKGSFNNHNTKVKSHGGSTVDDMYDYIAPLIKKKPANVILHVSTNDAPDKSARMIFQELSNLKVYIENELPKARVLISCPIFRTDNEKANRTLQELDSKLKGSAYDIVSHDNIDGTCLSRRGLHLNRKGSKILGENYIAQIQRF